MDSERTSEILDRVMLKAAEGTAKFYRAACNHALDPTAFGKERMQEVMGELPEGLRNLYARGLTQLDLGLKANHNIMKAHQGEEIDFLLNAYYPEVVKRPDYVRIKSGIRYLEPKDGMIFIIGEPFAFSTLDAAWKTKNNSSIVSTGWFQSSKFDKPSCIFIQDLAKKNTHPMGAEDLLNNTTARHELFHLVNWYLKDNYLRQPHKDLPDNINFENFRNEMVAYCLGKSGPGWVPNVGLMANTKNKGSEMLISKIKHIVDLAYWMLSDANIDTDMILYPLLKSRTYYEVVTNCARLVGAGYDYKVSNWLIGRLYNRYGNVAGGNLFLSEFISKSGLKIDPEELEKFGLMRLMTPPTKSVDEQLIALDLQEDGNITTYPHNYGYNRLDRVLAEADKIVEFGFKFGMKTGWQGSLVCDVISKRTGLSLGAAQVIEKNTSLDLKSVDLDGTAFETFSDLLTLSNLESPDFLVFAKQLIKEDVKLKQELEERLGVLDRLIWERYRQKFDQVSGVVGLKEKLLTAIKIFRFNALVKSTN